MIELRLGKDRGHADHGWLKSFHSFSFADYHDPRHMQFGDLRVINDDRLAPGAGKGFPMHGHRDMEIVSYILDGAMSHRDSMGNGSTIRTGDAQRMSAGTGIMHSEYNALDQVTHFLQIWVLPSVTGIKPGYEEKHFSAAEKRGRLRLVVSSDGRDGSVRWMADVSLYAGLFDGDERATLAIPAGRRAYVHIARGSARVNGQPLAAGDAAKLTDEQEVAIDQGRDAEALVFDLA